MTKSTLQSARTDSSDTSLGADEDYALNFSRFTGWEGWFTPAVSREVRTEERG